MAGTGEYHLTLIQIGARVWVSTRAAWTGEQGWLHKDYYEDEKNARELIEAYKINPKKLEHLGQKAVNIGVYRKIPTRTVEPIASHQPVDIFRTYDLADDSLDLDGTLPRSRARTGDERYLYGPEWKNNSCAIDVAMTAAIQMDVGRLQMDQIQAARFTCLREITQIMCFINRYQDWGAMSSALRQNWRSQIERAFQIVDSKYVIGTERPAAAVMEYIVEGLPSTTFHQFDGFQCCNGQVQAMNTAKVKSVSALECSVRQGSQVSLQDVINAYFITDDEADKTCTIGESCDRKIKRYRLVVDRLPPFLVLRVDNAITEEIAGQWDMFPPSIDITYRDTASMQTVQYAVKAAGFHIASISHFVLRVRHNHVNVSDRLYHYDGMKDEGQLKPKQDPDNWWADLDRSTRLAFVVLVRI